MNLTEIADDIIRWTKTDAWDWLTNQGLRITLILVGVTIVRHFSVIIIRRAVHGAIKNDSYATVEDEVRREDTLVSIISATIRISLWVVAGILILDEIGLNIGPLLAGAGIAGLAIGFGAQTLVRDFVSGLFIVMENQYRVGDVVSINGVSGVVVAVTMRTTVLRDLDGHIHHVTNGTIEHSTNMTFEYSGINLVLGVGYDTNIDKVEKIINKVGEGLVSEDEWSEHILEAPVFKRIDEFADSAINLLIVGKTAPGKQWMVSGELRKRYKQAFDKAGIEIPFPQRVIEIKEKVSEKKKPKSTKKTKKS